MIIKPEKGMILFRPIIKNKLRIVRTISIPFILFFNNKKINNSILMQISPEITPNRKILVWNNIGTSNDSSFNVNEYPIQTIPKRNVIKL